MNKYFINFFVAMLCVWGLAGTGIASAQAWQDFSADMVTTSGGQTVQGKMYVSNEKTRMEMPETIMITRFDKKLAWVVMTAQKMYMEHPLDPSMMSKVSKEVPGETERVPMGSEPVDGQPAQKFKVTSTQNGRQETIYQWIGQSDIPVKVQSADGQWTVEYKNIKLGAQEDALFEVPEGYEKFAMPTSHGSMASMMAAASNEKKDGE